MQYYDRLGLLILIILFHVTLGCSKGNTASPIKNDREEGGIRIVWDSSTFKKISASGPG